MRSSDDEVVEFLQHKEPKILAHKECDLCPNEHEDEITKDWRASGWDICTTCIEQGVAKEALFDEIRTIGDPDIKWLVEEWESEKTKAELSGKNEKYWQKLAHELREELMKGKNDD